jgi:prepilin-type processing-associated H-X9-DG protein
MLLPALNRARAKARLAACVNNEKQWGVAFQLYADDYNGVVYYAAGGASANQNFDDTDSPYVAYLGGGDPSTRMRVMRACPAVRARYSTDQITQQIGLPHPSLHTYSMPIGTLLSGGGGYADIAAVNNFQGWSIKGLPKPAEFLLLIDSRGNQIKCGGLVQAVTTLNSSSGDSITAVARHQGGVNCLFGDFHVEYVTLIRLQQQDSVKCSTGNPWFMVN